MQLMQLRYTHHQPIKGLKIHVPEAQIAAYATKFGAQLLQRMLRGIGHKSFCWEKMHFSALKSG